MSNYVQITSFTPKDSLLTGNPLKKVRGAELDPEFAAIASAISSKYDATNLSSAPILVADGAANAPGLAFASATGTGLYKPAANSLGFAANGVAAGAISSAGAWSIPAPTAGVGLAVSGVNNAYALQAAGSATSGQSLGLKISAGTTSADDALLVQNQGGTQVYLNVQGNGETYLVAPPAANTPPSGCFQVGYLDVPQNGQNVSYTLALTDRGKHILHNGGAGHTITIPTNASVPFPVGTSITIINNTGAGALTISLATDTLVWLPSGTVGGTRTLSGSGYATLIKVFSTQWMLMGAGIT